MCFACFQQDAPFDQNEIIISGKIQGYDQGRSISIIINDNGLATQFSQSGKIDSLGNFHIKFNRDYPQDVMIAYKSNFRVIVSPGDSLFIELDGRKSDREEILKTVSFSGDAAHINTHLIKYLIQFYKSEPNNEFIKQKITTLNPKLYKQFQDSIKRAREEYRDAFIKKESPDQKLINWITSNIKILHFQSLLDYPRLHRKYTESPTWNVDSTYYDFASDFGLSKQELIYSNTRWAINKFIYYYIWDIAREKAGFTQKMNPDSLLFNQAITLNPPGGITKQLVINEIVNTIIAKADTSFFKENEEVIRSLIHEEFLLRPLLDHYEIVKNRIQRSAKNKANDDQKPANEIWKSILDSNKGKVIYIDNWATWCLPCISAFPSSKELMNEYKEEGVGFIFLCFRSKRDHWMKLLSDYELEGQHFFLTEEEGVYFEDLFKINGFPSYTIIDKQGFIYVSGNDFGPSNEETKEILDRLLLEN